MNNNRIERVLFPVSIKTIGGQKWGYIDQSGQFQIYPQFTEADGFQDNGLAIVWVDQQAGVIDKTGKFVIPPIYEWIQPFSEGLAVALLEGKGNLVVDEKGQVVTAKHYPYISNYKEGRAYFQDGNLSGYLDEKGREVIPPRYEYANDFHDGKALVKIKEQNYALINKNGEVLQPYFYEMMGDYGEGFISFRKKYDSKSGYVNEAGKVVIPPRFTSAMPFEKGRAIVNLSENSKYQYGLIAKNGSYVIPPFYHDINIIEETRVSLGKAIDPEYPSIGSVFAVADSKTGRLLTDFLYDTVHDYDGEYSSVIQGIESFFINKMGQKVPYLPVIDGIGHLSIVGGVIKAFVDERMSYYDLKGSLIWTQNQTIPLTNKISIIEEKYRPNKNYLVYYPQIIGVASQNNVNQKLKELSLVKPIPADEPLYYSYSGDFTVILFQKNLLELELTGYEYPFGAAHGMPTRRHVNLDLRTGRMYRLQDLFKRGRDYINVISDIINKKINEQPEYYFSQDEPVVIKEDQPFYVTNEQLVIYFAPYEIASFAVGFPEFEIPYREIRSIIDKNGAFWRSFH